MFTSAELPLHSGAEPSPRADVFPAWDDGHHSPRVSHRVALTFIIGASLGCYALIYVIGSLVSRLLAAT